MASSANVLCRYYLNGACRDGSLCRFSHNRNDRPSTVCRYYQTGSCSYGSRCKFDHIRLERSTTNSSNNNNLQNGRRLVAVVNGNESLSARARRSSESLAPTTNRPVKPTSSNMLPPSRMDDIATKSKLRVDAVEFVPGKFIAASDASISKQEGVSYSEVVLGRRSPSQVNEYTTNEESQLVGSKNLLCPYNLMGQCWYGEMCSFTHGEMCDLCNRAVLHPTDKEFNAKHRQECLSEHEREMEAAFAVAKGREKQCGICMEIVMEKLDTAMQRFGILPSCKHCFCLECIRKWSACPECRTMSDYVVPSSVWVEEDDEKQALIETYLSAMKEKKCKYFKGGNNDECPFGNKCFYRHAKPDGTLVVGDSPRTIRRRMRQQQGGGARRTRFGGNAGVGGGASSSSAADLYVLWQFLEERDNVGDSSRDSFGSADWLWDELEYELDMLSVTDDSDSDAGDYYDLILS